MQSAVAVWTWRLEDINKPASEKGNVPLDDRCSVLSPLRLFLRM